MFVLLVILSFLIIRPFLLAIFLAALLAYIFYPLYKWASPRLGNRSLTSLLICLLILLLILIPSVFFVKTLVNESYSLYVLGKQKLSLGLFKDCHNQFCDLVKDLSQEPQLKYHLQESLKSITNWVIKKGSDLLISIPSILLNLLIVFFTLFYFLRDGHLLLKKFGNYLSMHKQKYLEILEKLGNIIHGLIYGYVLVAFLQGALGALGFFLFGLSSPLFWGMVMAFLALIPYLGTGLIWIPAAAFLLLEGIFQGSNLLIYKGIGLFFYGFIFIGSLDNIIRPKIIGYKTKIHPALIMVGVFGGLSLFGPLGIVIGPLVLSLATIIIEEYLPDKGKLSKK